MSLDAFKQVFDAKPCGMAGKSIGRIDWDEGVNVTGCDSFHWRM